MLMNGIDIRVEQEELLLLATALSYYIANHPYIKYRKSAEDLSEGLNHALRQLENKL
jgi:hypothetical protein